MSVEYITHYEVYKDGKPVAWGNQALTCGEAMTSGELSDYIRKNAVEQIGCKPEQVRILGVFKL